MMATTLAKADTRFLPFNCGAAPDGQGGAGNWQPEGESHATSYLWRDVWQRDAWMDLLQSFIHIEHPDPDEPLADPTMIFPRFHQWDCVLSFVNHARRHGAGHNYLAMHSTGSGKTNTIGWAQRRPALAELLDQHPAEVAVLFAPPADTALLENAAAGLGPLDSGDGRSYVDDVIALLQIVSQ